MENAKILIVDDDVNLAESLQITLENEQYTAITASDKPIEHDVLLGEIKRLLSECPGINRRMRYNKCIHRI